MPATVELQETVAVPDVTMLVGEMGPQVRPEGGASARVTVPVKPFLAAIMIVELADWSTLIPEGVLAVTVKSGGGGPRLRNLSKHPHPTGLLLHWSAP